MAEKAEKKEVTGPKKFAANASRSFRELRGEIKKVVWPTRKQVINNTIVVLVVVVLSSAAICAFDVVLSLVRNLLLGA
ncbi:MAG: preprotein translocase subunit SecE [Oscillospiraceae bacterium]